jgi:hypothetical protein
VAYERDKHLFHYTTREAAFSHILPTRRLKFSRYLAMRDPLENKSWRFLPGGWGEPDQEEKRRQLEGFATFDWIAAQIRERSFLLSMTQDSPLERGERPPFFHGWARARMWEQYAEAHLGVCLAFDRDALVESIVSSLQDQGFPSPYHRRVIYDGDGMQKPMLDLDDLAGDVTAEQVSSYIEENHEALFFHKVLDWETEHEYRFSTTSGDLEEPLVDFGDSLVGVIVGERFPPWERPGALASCRRAGVGAERLDWSMGAPALAELKPIENRGDEIGEVVERARRRPVDRE